MGRNIPKRPREKYPFYIKGESLKREGRESFPVNGIEIIISQLVIGLIGRNFNDMVVDLSVPFVARRAGLPKIVFMFIIKTVISTTTLWITFKQFARHATLMSIKIGKMLCMQGGKNEKTTLDFTKNHYGQSKGTSCYC